MNPAQYAALLLEFSERIVGAAHDDGPDELLRHIAAALAVRTPDGIDPVVALVTVLAAQVDPDTTADQRLGWTRRIADGRLCARPPRPAVPAPAPPPPPVRDLDRLVDDVTAGRLPLDELPRPLRLVPVQRLTEAGLTVAATAARLRCSSRSVERYRAKARAAA